MKHVFSGLCMAVILVSLPAAAAELCSKGTVAVIRVSTLKTAASRAGFDKAVQDQVQWYRGHGITTNSIVEANVIDLAGGAPALSAKEVMTIHYNPPAASGTQPAVDDGYKAFVKEFRDNSDIAVEKTVCLPK